MGKHSATAVGVQLAINYKALVAFGTPFISLLVFVATDPAVSRALGGTAVAWLLTIGIPAATGFFTWLRRNRPTIEQAQEQLNRALERGI